MVSIKRSWSRRDFLRAAGIVGGAGALAAIMPEVGDVRAAGVAPKRLLLVNTGNGTTVSRWRQGDLVHGGALPTFTSQLLSPLERHREKLVFIDGLDMGAAYGSDLNPAPIGGHPEGGALADGHSAIHVLWTGRNGNGAFQDGPGNNDAVWPDGPSIDQFIAEEIGGQTAIGSLQLANWRRGDACFDMGGTKLVNEFDAVTAFNRVFDGVVSNDDELARDKARKRRSLDHLRGEIGRLRTQLPGEDRERLDTHLHHFDALEARIEAAASCQVPMSPGGGLQGQALVDTMQQLIQQAFACDRTRVISYCLTSDNDFGPDDVLGFVPGYDLAWGGPHALSHASESSMAAVEVQTAVCEWEAQMFAELLDLLDAVPEGPGETMLDNTVVVWGQHLSHGGTHLSRATPCVVATGKNGRIETNKYLRFGDYDANDLGKDSQGRDYDPRFECEANNRLLVSLCHAFGREDVTEFGDARFAGPLPGLEVV